MPGTEKLPPLTDSSAVAPAVAANSDTNSAAKGRSSPSRMIRENVHTNVLGRDACDSTREIGFATDDKGVTNANANATTNTNDQNSGWWGSGLLRGSDENRKTTNAVKNINRKRRNGNAKYDGLQQSSVLEDGAAQYDPPPLSSTTVGSSSSLATDDVATDLIAITASREDRVRQDCSYFYRGMEDDPSSPYHKTRSHRTGKTTAAANSLLRRMSVRARLSGQVDGALFMSRYERLNQVIHPHRQKSSKTQTRHQQGQQYTGNDNSSNQDNNEDHHDLFLDEDDGQDQPSSYREHVPSPTNNVVMGATSLINPHGVRSSMFFEQDGRMLMRLPRDQVRLVMDYNLEPGILSVEQWRNQEDAEATSEKLAMQNERTRLSMQRERKRERRHQRRGKEQRRRRRRRRNTRKQRELQQQQFDGDNRNNNIHNEGEQTIDEEDPLATKGGGQLPLEGVPMEEEKGRQTDIEEDDDSYSSYSDDSDSYLDDDLDEPFEELLPDLKYVITIPDDMYRRMVGEISAKVFPPYWGFFKCCNQESEQADIKLALLLLSVVMSLLFVGSLEWRTT